MAQTAPCCNARVAAPLTGPRLLRYARSVQGGRGMALRVAVVTDSISDEFFFPLWRRYYGGLFGEQALHVVAYEGGARFADPTLGGVLRLPVGYEDGLRARLIGDYVATLLHAHDVVVRVDVDEFLVADPRHYPSLRHFIAAGDAPHLAARGFDVIQTVAEPPLQPGPVLAQRQWAYPNSALNKTCIVRRPRRWTPGFHWCDAAPVFGPLFMLHLKRVDMAEQFRWAAAMTGNIGANPQVGAEIKAYYRPAEAEVLKYHLDVSMRPRLKGIEAWYRDDFQQDFAASVAQNPASGMHVGRYGHDHVLCEIPDAWRGLL